MTNEELQIAIDRSTNILFRAMEHTDQYREHQKNLVELLKIQRERAVKPLSKSNRSKDAKP